MRAIRKILFFLLYLAFLLVLLEIGVRVFLTVKLGVPFFHPSEMTYVFYPEARAVKNATVVKGDGVFDVFLLGASVLNNGWGNIEELLGNALQSKTAGKVKVHTVAIPAHTSLDSYYKFRHVAEKPFDLVLFYDAINEVRANNCPPGMFAQDYSHYSWYKNIALFDGHKEARFLVFPWALHYAASRVWKKLHGIKYVPIHEPTPEWTAYGSDIKTADTFRKNLTRLLDLAKAKGDTVMLMTFAYYVPEDYSQEKFKAKALDYAYTPNSMAIETWGRPENVVKGIQAHNEVLRDLASRYDNVVFVDQEKLIPKEGAYFQDICHFSPKGCEAFVANVVAALPAEQ